MIVADIEKSYNDTIDVNTCVDFSTYEPIIVIYPIVYTVFRRYYMEKLNQFCKPQCCLI